MGVHYPTDVIGGFALGTAVALLLAPLALALLTPVLSAVARSGRGARLVRSRRADAPRHPETVGIPEPRVGGPATGTDHNDLAA